MIKVYVHNREDWIGEPFWPRFIWIGHGGKVIDCVVFDSDDWTEIGEL